MMDTYDRIIAFIKNIAPDAKVFVKSDNHDSPLVGHYARLSFENNESAKVVSEHYGAEYDLEEEELDDPIFYDEQDGIFGSWLMAGHGFTEEEALEDLFDMLLLGQTTEWTYEDFEVSPNYQEEDE